MKNLMGGGARNYSRQGIDDVLAGSTAQITYVGVGAAERATGTDTQTPNTDASHLQIEAYPSIRIIDGNDAYKRFQFSTEDPEVARAAQRLRNGRYLYRFTKRTFDILFSAAVLILFSWVYLAIAIAIKLDDPRGPVFFKQVRVGRDGREFNMYKFRSMCANAESMLDQLRALNEKSGPVFKIAKDPRITRVGRFIRKLSLDELPQFFNVFKGDISIVGPRPALPKEIASYSRLDRQRLLVHQGLTCYWQTRLNRDCIEFDDWMELDRLYVKRCGAITDTKLVIQTIGVVLTAQGS